MRDCVEISSAPCDEDCVQVNPKVDYLDDMRAECEKFRRLVRVKMGPEPEGARLGIKSNPHDFGTYLEVVCYYEDTNEEARKYAWRCESEAPRTWDDDGRREATIEAMAKAPTTDEMVAVLKAAQQWREAAMAAAGSAEELREFLQKQIN